MDKSLNSPVARYAGLVIVLASLALGGCETAPRSPATPLAAPVSPQRHVVRSAQLRRIMQRLEELMQDRIQSDLALDKKRNDTTDSLADVAGELAAAALSISTNAVPEPLDEAGRQRFHAYAVELRREAEILRAAAAERRFMAATHQFQRLSHVCAGCHSLYRER